MDTNYFVCTLGQAANLRTEEPKFNNINEFIDHQAQTVGKNPAVGFFSPSEDRKLPWKHQVLDFSSVRNGSLIVAHLLARKFGERLQQRQTVALVCPSSPTFLFVWLGLMRLGHSVLLIAPQSQPAAIAHLCNQCQVSTLLSDYPDLSQRLKSPDTNPKRTATNASQKPDLSVFQLSTFLPPDILQHISEHQDSPEPNLPQHDLSQTDTAYLHHTSGTSSGLPKPIPQSHRAAVRVLPHLPASATATFTTTPLYHGGIADLFRAWASDAAIWLFPGHALPITAANVAACLQQAASDDAPALRVAYFSSVPYVLQMLEADPAGLAQLRAMRLVGVGGAALPAAVGDRLVRAGVRLVARYGSAECGFLLSSHRDYDGDGEWQFLRAGRGAEFLSFEERGDEGVAEVVVLPGWPHMAKTNREDGAFATADLMAPHPEIEHAWRYHSRADSQLTLVTGKKFDPAPLEAAIAASPFLDDVLIFGNGRPFPGALLFRAEEFASASDDELTDAVRPAIEKLNEESQGHARIPRNMLVPMPHDPSALEKSSKGTVMRGRAEEKYTDLIERAYSNLSMGDGSKVPDGEVLRFITDLIERVVLKSKALTEEDDLFAFGVDSVACMQIRYGLRQLLPKTSPELPLSIVEDCGTVRRLNNFMTKMRHGESYADEENEHDLMIKLVERYSNFEEVQIGTQTGNGTNDIEGGADVVVLTGATGALGAHILDLYRSSDTASKIYCLVRGADEHAAKERVNKALTQKGFSPLTSSHPGNSKVIILQSQLGELDLGLSTQMYETIAAEATIIMHIAWSVNFRMRLRSFEKDNIAGVHNLISLALRSPRPVPPRFAYCSSVASAINVPEKVIPEQIMEAPKSASPLGYSRSKWVAERICHNAHYNTRLRSRIAIFRVGQLSGDTQNGIWNTQEAWPMMLSTARLTGCLPALEDEPLNWLPVDVAAKSFVQALSSRSAGEKVNGSGENRPQVYHVLNENQEPNWMRLLSWLKKMEDFEIVDPQDWLGRLEKSKDQEENKNHPAMRLLGHWKNAYGESPWNPTESQGTDPSSDERQVFAMDETKKVAPVLDKVRPVDEEYFKKIWSWLRDAKMN